ncbi:MAG: hypothetical protein LEGION0398_MBIBDBAK_00544 [Legionellaceae bacterium]
MTVKMKSIPIRLDNDIYQNVVNNSKEKGIKISRYIRSLIDKGLIVENYLPLRQDSERHNKVNNISDNNSLDIIAGLCAENLMITRQLYSDSLKDKEKYIENLTVITEKSKLLLSRKK